MAEQTSDTQLKQIAYEGKKIKKMNKEFYESELVKFQIELLKLQRYVKLAVSALHCSMNSASAIYDCGCGRTTTL